MLKSQILQSQVSQSQDPEYLEYQGKVVEALKNLPQGKVLAEVLIADRDFLHFVSPEQVTEVKKIEVRKGYAPQELNENKISTRFDAYLEAVINPQIRSGKLTDGTRPRDYDDRKVRWSGAGVAGFSSRDRDIFTLEIAPTTYPRYRLDLARSPLDALKLMMRGLERYRDPYAYFARAIGVAVVPLTAEGNVYIGERSPEVDCPGVLNFVAGLATFSSNIEEIDFLEDARRELWEEVGIAMTLDDSNTKFIGISGNPLTGEVDLVFIVETAVSDRHFQSGQWSEHSRLISISNKNEAKVLLEQGFLPGEKEPRSLMYSSRLGLEYLVQNH